MNIPFQQAGDMIDPDNVFAVIDSKLSTIEREHDLLRFKVDGWCAWAVLRFWVASQMIDIGLTREPATSNLARKLRVALRSLGGFIFPRKARYLVKTYTSARSEQENGRYKDVYFDDLLLKLGNYLKIEAINNFSMWERTKAALVPADMYTAIVEMLVFVFVWLSGATGRYAVMSEEISGILKREASLEITALRISKSLANFHWSRKIFGWYLDRVKPEYLLTADPGEYAITAAAKERGIRCIEIMHGICDRYCWAYSWGTHAVPYKHAMPVADKLLVYGDFIKDEILPLGFWGEALRVTGSVRLDDYRDRHLPKLAERENSVTLTTQGIERERIIRFVVEFLEQAKKEQVSLRLFVKLHPVYDPDPLPYRAALAGYEGFVSVISADQAPSTFELIAVSYLHASISSSCHYEALGLGVPTIVLPFPTYQGVDHLVKSGHAILVHSPRELLDVVRDGKNRRVPQTVSRYYFEHHALDNILNELNS